ncbi:hypothetical protein A134_22960 [Vibrio crassostreae 9CS106]|nr:hypothetical protein A134_22960 [Vibrio crassostreae 9CS106]
MARNKMSSLYRGIYNDPDVIVTLAWLLNRDEHCSDKYIVKESVRRGLININSSINWNANGRNIFRYINKKRMKLPPPENIDKLSSCLRGLGEMSARSNSDFEKVVSIRLSGYFYRKTLIKVLNELINREQFIARERSIEEKSYSRAIALKKFNWQGFKDSAHSIRYDSQYGNHDYGIYFVVRLCAALAPQDYSCFVEQKKHKEYVGELCRPLINSIIFKDRKRSLPLMRGNCLHLKLLTIVAFINDDVIDNNTSISEIQNILLKNNLSIHDVIWISASKLQEVSNKIKQLSNQIDTLNQEILQNERNPSLVNSEYLIISRIKDKKGYEIEIQETKDKLNLFIKQLVNIWPNLGLQDEKLTNILFLITDDKLLLDLSALVPSLEDKIKIRTHIIKKAENWIGINPKHDTVQKICDQNFTYSSLVDSEKFHNISHCFVLLANDKNQILGKFLGKTVQATDKVLEEYITRPFINVRNPMLWHSATTRLAAINLLSILVFTNTPLSKISEISPILPIIIRKVSLLLKIIYDTDDFIENELYRDLKTITANLIANNKLNKLALEIVDDKYLPFDYRARIIFSNEELIKDRWEYAVDLFKRFLNFPLFLDTEYKHFSESICLLDLCISYCWRYNTPSAVHAIAHIWNDYCSSIDDKTIAYKDYATRLYLALQNEGEERIWLKNLEGFGKSHCMTALAIESNN